MDIYDRVAAAATAYVMTNYFLNVSRSRVADIISDDNIQWVVRLATTFYMPEGLEVPGRTGGPELGDMIENATEIALGIPLGDQPVPDRPAEPPRSYAIGGPEVEAQIALREAWDVERDVLLEKQAGEVVKAETMAAKARSTVEDRTAGSPEQQQRLDDFDKTFGEYRKDMADRHGAEIRQLDDKWQEKFREFEQDHGRVEVYPEHTKTTDPERDLNR
jgi:hypothetical protein